MANTVLNAPQKFPAGTVVKAYPAAKAQRHALERTPPDDLTATDTATVQSDGTLTFTGLTAGTPYLCWAQVSTSGAAVSRTTVGDGTHNEVDVITVNGLDGASPSGGTFTITVNTGTGGAQTTAAIPYNATKEHIQLALEALSNIDPGDVAVTGSAGGPWTLTFGGALADTAITVTVDDTLVTGASKHRFLQVVGN